MFSYFRTADELMSQQEPDDLPIRTDEVCPFCGRFVEWDGDQLYCEPCRRTWPDFSDLRLDRHEVKYAARKAADEKWLSAMQDAADDEREAEWQEAHGDDQRDEDGSGYADAVAEGLERWTR